MVEAWNASCTSVGCTSLLPSSVGMHLPPSLVLWGVPSLSHVWWVLLHFVLCWWSVSSFLVRGGAPSHPCSVVFPLILVCFSVLCSDVPQPFVDASCLLSPVYGHKFEKPFGDL